MTDRLLGIVAVVACLACGAVAAQDVQTVPVGYVELAEDPRHANNAAHAGIAFRTLGRPRPGAELGIEDADAIGRFIGYDFSLVAESGDVPALAEAVRAWVGEGVGFVLTDLPAAELVGLADLVADLPVTLLNVSAPEDALRGVSCRANLLHAIPSEAMRADALVQYLVTRDWTRLLVLRGATEADRRSVAALKRAAERFGAEIVEIRDFALTADPRRRGESNVALMTSDAPEHDVVYVADASGEFDRYVGYRTVQPRPVVGTAGLSPVAWHWSWDRYGAPQVQHRFEELALPRRMNGSAWAAYAAVKAVTQAAMRSDVSDPAAMRAYLRSDDLRLDASKGVPMSFRSWSGQLRQPILLATPDATIATAPLAPFLHRTNDLDTLGIDAPESACNF